MDHSALRQQCSAQDDAQQARNLHKDRADRDQRQVTQVAARLLPRHVPIPDCFQQCARTLTDSTRSRSARAVHLYHLCSAYERRLRRWQDQLLAACASQRLSTLRVSCCCPLLSRTCPSDVQRLWQAIISECLWSRVLGMQRQLQGEAVVASACGRQRKLAGSQRPVRHRLGPEG